MEEKGRREVSGRGVGTEGENARHPSHRRLVHRKGNNGGEVSFATPRDGRQRKSSSLSRFSFIDTRGFVF